MSIILDDLDKKLIDNFRGFVVKRRMFQFLFWNIYWLILARHLTKNK